jgi:hypothetical protein
MSKKENRLTVKLLLQNLLIFLVVFTSLANKANAQQVNNYMVEGIAAKASARSSGDAKILATASARKDAFVILLSRLALNPSLVNNISNDDLFDMVNSEQITEERISGSSYSAIFNIAFSESAVKRILRDKNINKTDDVVENYLLIPVKILKPKSLDGNSPNELLLWEAENNWKIAIEKEIKNSSIPNFIVPESDLSNITSLNKENIEQVSFNDLEPILTKYKSSEGLVMFFYYDDIENKVIISVQNVKKLQKKLFKLNFVNVERLNYEQLTSKVAQKTIEYLLTLKSGNKSKSETNFIKIEIPISKLGDWMMIKNKIENSNLINQLNIESISKDYVRISVNYTENQTDIIEAFAQKNIFLEKKAENLFSLSLTRNIEPRN